RDEDEPDGRRPRVPLPAADARQSVHLRRPRPLARERPRGDADAASRRQRGGPRPRGLPGSARGPGAGSADEAALTDPGRRLGPVRSARAQGPGVSSGRGGEPMSATGEGPARVARALVEAPTPDEAAITPGTALRGNLGAGPTDFPDIDFRPGG